MSADCAPQYILPDATRRVKLRFDINGDPAFESVKSPQCFEQKALGVLPPRDVIPIIFVPGIAGSNLRTIVGHEKVWSPPNGTFKGIWDGTKTKWVNTKELQRLYDPLKTEVDLDGDCTVSDKTYWLTTEEAKRRRWGGLHAMSYHEFLQNLETSLNDQYTRPGYGEDRGNFLLPEIGMLQYLRQDAPSSSITPEDRIADERREAESYYGTDVIKWTHKPDYAKLAKETIKAWGRITPSLSAQEIKKLNVYYYPVWAYPYNWLDDAEKAAKGLVDYIDVVLQHYVKGKYFRHQGQVIIITHSMGGLVTRRAAQIAPNKVLGVVHGVCPLVGAAVFYRRMRKGQEGGGPSENVVAAIMGNTQEEMTLKVGRSPGALTLAPTKDYPPDWLRFYSTEKEDKESFLFSLPKVDPYEEVYSKTTDNVWWGMLDPALLDPMGVMTGKNENTPTATYLYKGAVKLAKEFHERLKLYAHPDTYGFYGTDNKKYRSFGHVSWLCGLNGENNYSAGRHVMKINGWNQAVYTDKLDHMEYLKEHFIDKTKQEFIARQGKMHPYFKRSGRGYVVDEFEPASLYLPIKGVPNDIPFWLTEERNMPGDGTVPACSGEMLNKLTPPLKEVFAIPGYGHQSAYDDPYAYRATIYCITRIIQKAKSPSP